MDTQFKKGVLDICVLATILKKEMYGYGLKMEMSQLMDINENTLYPLLRRLGKEGYLETYSKESQEGRMRKYYAVTKKGEKYLKSQMKQWHCFIENVEHILEGIDENE